jgi:hypothetical protein
MYMAKQIPGVEVLDDGAEIDTVAGNKDFKQIVQDEAFANETLMVYFHPTSDEREVNSFVLNVGGINAPVIKGHIIPMKRKFVEVAARMKQTKYVQRDLDPNDRSKTALVPTTTLVHPFDVRQDKNPKGAAWLAAVLAERA